MILSPKLPRKQTIRNTLNEMYPTTPNSGILLQKAVASLAVTFRKRAASGLQSGRGFVLPDATEQVHEKTDLELVTWLVIKQDKA
jgi:hypothetical protein